MVRNNEVDAQLRRILESPAFVTSARSRQFLEFCVDRTIRGESSQLKETTIAVEVFLRSADYDPKLDPIVRVHARRVREKLDLYYRDFGADDPIKIDLPKGGYVAQILRNLPRRKTDFSDWSPPLIADNQESASIAPSPAAIHPSASAITSQHRLHWIAIGLAVLVAVFATFVWLSKGRSQKALAEAGPLTPVDLGADRASDFTWSPDGTHLAFTLTEKDNKTRIYIKAFPANLSPSGSPKATPATRAIPSGRPMAMRSPSRSAPISPT